jgi:hypothetical protein
VRKGLFLEDKRDLALRLNVYRRHLSAAERDKLKKDRKARVKEARRQGKSLRSIAEQEGVSKSQVANDLADSYELSTSGQLEEVSPPNGKVVGKDGKPRPAKRRTDPIIAAWRRQPNERAADWLARLGAVPEKLKKSRFLSFRKLFKSAQNHAVLEEGRERKNQTKSPPPDLAIEPQPEFQRAGGIKFPETPGKTTLNLVPRGVNAMLEYVVDLCHDDEARKFALGFVNLFVEGKLHYFAFLAERLLELSEKERVQFKDKLAAKFAVTVECVTPETKQRPAT